jgi:hypothetical protein
VSATDQRIEILQDSLDQFRLFAGPPADIPPVVVVIVVAERSADAAAAIPRSPFNQHHIGGQEVLHALFVVRRVAVHAVELAQVVVDDHLAPDGRLCRRNGCPCCCG